MLTPRKRDYCQPEKGRTTSTSRKAEESLSVAPQDDPEASTSHSQPQPNDARLNEALARVESGERERKNAMAREKRAKTTVRSLLGDLREKNLINEELKERLDFYSDLQIDFKAKQGHEYSKDHREWLCSVDGKPGLNKMMLDMLERRCQEDQATYGCVALIQITLSGAGDRSKMAAPRLVSANRQ
ncbi:hypothetical protein NQZ68_008489 [Dissostichus eleginoides]|nr:hypothetical protein NQZ68_008489 [Dissostichus eleginoides]